MNANSFKIMRHERKLNKPIWFFKYGFGLWIGRVMITVGHDIRSTVVEDRQVQSDE